MTFENVYNLDLLRPAIEQAKDEIARAIANDDVGNPWEDGESVEWVLSTVVSGAAGTHQPEEIASTLDLEFPIDARLQETRYYVKDQLALYPKDNREDAFMWLRSEHWPHCLWNIVEWAWEEIDSQVSALDDWLNAALQDSLGCEYSLYHGSNESDGAYELFLSFTPCDNECSLRRVVRSFLAKESGFSDLKEVLR